MDNSIDYNLGTPEMITYLNWIRDETNNPSLTERDAGVNLALKLLAQVDPFELFDDKVVLSESIEGMSQTYQVNEDGIPLKVLRWIRPYYMLGSL